MALEQEDAIEMLDRGDIKQLQKFDEFVAFKTNCL